MLPRKMTEPAAVHPHSSRPPVWAILAAICAWAGLLALSSLLYRGELTGVPDEGPIPASALPFFLFQYGPASGLGLGASWIFACLAYLLPPAIVTGASASLRSAVVSGTTAVGLLLVGATINLLPLPKGGEDWAAWLNTGTAAIGLGVVAGLALVGAAAGLSNHTPKKPFAAQS